MKIIFFLFFCLYTIVAEAQTKPGTNFSGTNTKDPNVCAASAGNFMTEQQVENLITEMLGKIGTKNRYIIVNCTQVENCQAFLYKGRPYILYNPNFLGRVKRLNFSEATLPSVSDKEWETLTILAHELGHHVNNHLMNPLPDATQQDMELEADETAGFIIYLLGGSQSQAQLAYINIPEKSSYTHPGRQKRMDAIAKGWSDAEKRYPRLVINNNPTNKLVTNDENTVTDIDGNVYKAVKIGKQVWMQSNLNVSKFRDGTLIPQAKTEAEWKKASEQSKPAWCYYENKSAYGQKYGKLYNWYALNDKRGLAPAGYHIPSMDEWTALIWQSESNKGGYLKATNTWMSPNTGANNNSGFSALPGGGRESYGTFSYLGTHGIWWTKDEHSVSKNSGGCYLMNHDNGDTWTTVRSKGDGYTIRCIKD